MCVSIRGFCKLSRRRVVSKHWKNCIALRYYDMNGEVDESPETVYYGAEFEFCCTSGLAMQDLRRKFEPDREDRKQLETLMCGSDGSVSPFGVEIRSHPMTRNRLYCDRGVGYILSLINDKDGRYFVNRSCGGHIHISSDPITPEQLENLAYFVYGERCFSAWISGRDKLSLEQWARLDDGVLPRILRFKEETFKKKSKDLHPQYHTNSALCINADTLEFRLFRGTLYYSEFFKNVEFIDLALKLAESRFSAKQFIEACLDAPDDHPHLADFLVMFRSPSLAEKRIHPDVLFTYDAHKYYLSSSSQISSAMGVS
jgi:hypothetical protein